MIEACAVGIVVVILGYLINYLIGQMKLKMDKNIQMTMGLFFIGAVTHLFCEFTGVNKWYCKKGHACLSK
jgi:hypothetical protein